MHSKGDAGEGGLKKGRSAWKERRRWILSKSVREDMKEKREGKQGVRVDKLLL